MKNLTILLLLFFSNTIHSQILISNGGTVPVSGGELFYDAGGAAGTDGNTNYTITLSPATPGEMVCIDFTSFITEMDSWGGINGADKLEIFDGPTTAYKNIGSLQGNYGNKYNGSSTNGSWNVGQPAVSTAAAELKPGMFCANNASGVLTLKFTNQNSDQNAGWVANIVTFVKATVGCNINFTADNTTICNGDVVQLTALGNVVSPSIQTDFNTSLLGPGWTASPGSLSFMSVLSCQPNNGFDSRNTDNSIFAWMQNTVGTRNLETNGFNVSGGGWMSFDFREASDDNGGNGCEALDDEEGVYVQYSINNGANWITMKLMFPGRESGGEMGTGDYVYSWGTVTLPIPAGAISSNTKFRWIQFSNSGGSTDSWGIDNIKVSTITTPTLTITNLTTGAIVGTSSISPYTVSVSPTSTTNYQASITDGTTTCVFPLTITVTSSTTPTFTAVTNVCQNATPPVLPTTSTNSITGTWSPAVSTAAVGTATYTFTPTVGQCASTTTLTVTTIAPTIPTFNAVSDVCLNSSAPILPTNSTNTTPIPGAWSPSVSTSVAGTAVYTFTPASGQCATTANLSIVTTTTILPTFAAIPAVCQNATAPVLPVSSNNVPAISGTWAPAVSTSVLGVVTYTFTPAAGQCAINTTLNITVTNPLVPTFTAIANVCQNVTAPVLPTTSTNTFSGTWSPAVSTAAVGTATYTFAPSTGQCASTTTLTITTIAPTIPTFNAVSDVCLNSSAPILPTNSTNTTPIPGAWSPAVSTAVAGTAVYTFTPTSGQCSATASLSIVTTTTILPTFAAIPNVCQNATAPTLPVGSTNTPVITGAWAPAISTASLGTSAYTFTPNPGQCASNTTINITVSTPVLPTFTPIANVCQNATAPVLLPTSLEAFTGTWLPAVSTATMGPTTYTFTPTTGQCANTTSLTITINPAPILSITNPAGVCKPLSINLTDNSITTGSTAGASLTYWTNIGATSPLSNPSTVSTSGTYYIVSTVQGCSSIMPVTVVIYPSPNATFTSSSNFINNQESTVNLTNNSIGGTTYTWDFGDGQSSTAENPSITYLITDQANYLITLLVISEFGCVDSTSLLIEVKEELIYFIPNSFTPDGDDHNQVFQPIFTSGYDPDTYHLSIFNRWGELIFESFDFSKGWDGVNTLTNIKDSDGTYSWKIEFKLKGTKDKEKLYGHVNLLK